MPESEGGSRDRLSGLYRHNLSQLTDEDVVIASYGGAGQALLGNMLLELGLNYVDAYTEELLPTGESREVAAHSRYRSRLGTGRRRALAGAPWPRFVKSHVPVRHFAESHFGAVWVLVRDPRDALYSWYNWRLGFAEEIWDRLSCDSFLEFLHDPDYGGATPVSDWAHFYAGWLDEAERRGAPTVIHFEALKQRPDEVLSMALDTLSVHVSPERLSDAAASSSYEAMRAREDSVAGQAGGQPLARIMRSGKVSGWTEWLTPELAACFGDPELVRVAARLGYRIDTGEWGSTG